jgi:N-acetylglucosaminyldiphosphoundecaprenol N-acetyl-beta-D-mannosaminyltransferase
MLSQSRPVTDSIVVPVLDDNRPLVHARRRAGSAVDAIAPVRDDLSRNVHCILGTPIDVVEMATVLSEIRTAATGTAPYLISTPNLNYLIQARRNLDFRQTLLASDLCPADGIGVVFVAWLLGVAVQRVAGSDIFDALVAHGAASHGLRMFFFGGENDVAERAVKRLAMRGANIRCVGQLNPGFGTIETMSSETTLQQINDSGANFLVVALGSQKGQAWLAHNHAKLKPCVRVHLGAVLKFQAGDVRRAPPIVRRLALEWLWRIKEEPALWRRYRDDAMDLLRLDATRLFAAGARVRWERFISHFRPRKLTGHVSTTPSACSLMLSGDATTAHIENAVRMLRCALDECCERLCIDMTGVRFVDSRFLGLLLMAHKTACHRGKRLCVTGMSRGVAKIFRLNDLEFLLAE